MTFISEFNAAFPATQDNQILVPDTVAQSALGLHLTNNLLRLAKRAPNDHMSESAPTVDNDIADTAGIGVRFRPCSQWVWNVGGGDYVVYFCVDATAGAAVWRPLGDPSQVFLRPFVDDITIAFDQSGDAVITGHYFDVTSVVTIADHTTTTTFVSPTELHVSLTSGSWGETEGAGDYAATVSNAVGTTAATAHIVEDYWIDFRSTGSDLDGLVFTQNNWNLGSQLEANSGLVRDPAGMWSILSSGFNQWLKFPTLAFSKNSNTRVSWLFRTAASDNFMCGAGPTLAAQHNEVSGTQYYDGHLLSWRASGNWSSTVYGGGVSAGGSNWSFNIPTFSAVDPAASLWRVELDDGGNGNLRYYSLTSDARSGWNGGTLKATITTPFANGNNPSPLTNLCPFITGLTVAQTRLVGLEVKVIA